MNATKTQIDRRPIFTVGMVWPDLVKRLPRAYPRYQFDAQKAQGNLQALQQYALQQQNLSPDQRAILYQQQQQFGAYCNQSVSAGGRPLDGWPWQFGGWPWR